MENYSVTHKEPQIVAEVELPNGWWEQTIEQPIVVCMGEHEYTHTKTYVQHTYKEVHDNA